MAFWLKKFISSLLLPLPLGIFFMAVGIILIVLHRTKRINLVCLFAGWLIITLFSLSPISSALINHLQLQYSPLIQPPKTVNTVVVLGGGINYGKNYPPNLTLSSASLSRLVEGIRLFKMIVVNHPQAVLVLSGGRVFQSSAVSGKMQNTAILLGLNKQNIVLENGSRDTREEALFLQKTLGNKPFILVTSAYHMPRAIALFERLGMHPIAAPTQFLNQDAHFLILPFPSTQNLLVSDIALHEYLGILWGKLRGYIKP